MKKLCIGIVSVLLMTVLLVPTSSKAAKGFLLGLGVGAGIPSDSNGIGGTDVKTGVASYLDIGYGFNKYFTAGGYFGSGEGTQKSYDTSITWYQPYFGAYGRFTLPVGDSLEPYANIGLGAYMFSAAGGDIVMYSKSPTFGLKFGGGLNWFLGKDKKWFIGPELAYQYVPYDQNFRVAYSGVSKDQLQHAGYPGSFDIKMKDNANVFEVLFKFGYQWKK